VQGRARGAAALIGLLGLFAASPLDLMAQERGAIALGEAIDGLGVNARVLMIGAHPDDEDTFLITWLQRGRHVETAYLSLTRGDGGQNLIGNELGEALGVIRTEELLAARRIDGARQYFTRAFDFGFSKDTIDTYKHWQRDSILNDVVRVVRAFRPHVIVAVFSGTPRDGHGHHQVSGLLARAAYDIAADTIRFRIAAYGAPWAPLKFYRAARFNQQGGTLAMDVGEYSPLLGRSYGEIAGESRSQHKSQGFGALQRKGPIIDNLRREASRVNESAPATSEKSMFDGIDTTWARFRTIIGPQLRAALDSIPQVLAVARSEFDAFRPASLVPPLVRAMRLLRSLCQVSAVERCASAASADPALQRDFATSVAGASARVGRALQLAAGIEFEVVAVREAMPTGSIFSATASVFNRGADTAWAGPSAALDAAGAARNGFAGMIPPGGVWRDTVTTRLPEVSQPWWLVRPRAGAMFTVRSRFTGETGWGIAHLTEVRIGRAADTVTLSLFAAYINRVADPVKGEVERVVAGVPAIAVTLDAQVEFARAGVEFSRDVEVHLLSADEKPRDVLVSLALPRGLTADSASRATRLERYGVQTVTFRVRGQLTAGEYHIDALASSNGESFSSGYEPIDYDHIRRQRVYRPASMKLSAVDVRVPENLRVAYITGVGDNVAPTLSQLGIPVTIIAAADIVRADLTPYTAVVIGPRAYEAHPELLAANPRLFDFARKGGALVVQYGQSEMTLPGAMPFPITLSRPADRVTDEDAVVTIDAPTVRELLAPNRIVPSDFAGWVQERSLYMPRTFDAAYRSLMSMNDTGEAPNKGGVLIAPLGDGLYIYASLSFFRQLPAGVPGGARLFVNLLSANLKSPSVTP